LLEVLVAFLFVVVCFAPFRYRLTVEDENVEESVKKEDVLRLDRSGVKQYGLSNFLIKGAGKSKYRSSNTLAP